MDFNLAGDDLGPDITRLIFLEPRDDETKNYPRSMSMSIFQSWTKINCGFLTSKTRWNRGKRVMRRVRGQWRRKKVPFLVEFWRWWFSFPVHQKNKLVFSCKEWIVVSSHSLFLFFFLLFFVVSRHLATTEDGKISFSFWGEKKVLLARIFGLPSEKEEREWK